MDKMDHLLISMGETGRKNNDMVHHNAEELKTKLEHGRYPLNKRKLITSRLPTL